MCTIELFNQSINQSIHPYLSGNSVGACGEQLGDAGGLETLFRQTKGSSETGPTGPHHHGIKDMVYHRVVTRDLRASAQQAQRGRTKERTSKEDSLTQGHRGSHFLL
jgi:hypothetical protein